MISAIIGFIIGIAVTRRAVVKAQVECIAARIDRDVARLERDTARAELAAACAEREKAVELAAQAIFQGAQNCAELYRVAVNYRIAIEKMRLQTVRCLN